MDDVAPLEDQVVGSRMDIRDHRADLGIETLHGDVDLEPGHATDPELRDRLFEEPLDFRGSGLARYDDFVRQSRLCDHVRGQYQVAVVFELVG